MKRLRAQHRAREKSRKREIEVIQQLKDVSRAVLPYPGRGRTLIDTQRNTLQSPVENATTVAQRSTVGYAKRVRELIKDDADGVSVRSYDSYRLERVNVQAQYQKWCKTHPLTSLWDHQLAALDFFAYREDPAHGFRGLIYADKMGFGKTLAILYYIYQDIKRRIDRQIEWTETGQPDDAFARFGAPTLIACPLTVVDIWRRELHKRFGGPGLVVRILPDQHVAHLSFETIARTTDIVIASYDVIKSSAVASHRSYRFLFGGEWHRVVCDEAHRLSNRDTVLYKIIHENIQARYKWFVSGTPMENTIESLFSALDFIGEDTRAMRKSSASDAEIMKACVAALATCMLRRQEVKLLRALPRPADREPGTVVLGSGDPQRTPYDEYHVSLPFASNEELVVYRECLTIIQTQPHQCLPLLQALRHSCLVPMDAVKTNILAEALRDRELVLPVHPTKVKRLVSDLRRFDPRRKVLVFSESVRALRTYRRHVLAEYPACGSELFHGGLGDMERTAIVNRFRAPDGDIRVLFTSLRISDVGLNLPEASIVIFISFWWNPNPMEQAIYRCVRPEQTIRPEVHYYTIHGSIEEFALEICQHKQRQAKRALDQQADDPMNEEASHIHNFIRWSANHSIQSL